MKTLEEANIFGKTVLVRIGADVPMSKTAPSKITDDSRLRVLLPTLQYLINRKCRIVLCAHLGRPGGKVDRDYTLRPVYLRLSALLKRPIIFAPTLFSEKTRTSVESLGDGELLGLENLRFDPGEERNSRTFARKLAEYGEVFVNEAFNVAHHEGASFVAITEFLPSYAGLQFEKEVSIMRQLVRHPARPFVVVVGGVKIDDKLPVLKYLAQHADKILIGGGVANTFLAALGKDVGSSVVDADYFEHARTIFRRSKGKIVLPVDYVTKNGAILDIGHDTTKLFLKYLKTAQTIFWNGSLGKAEEEEYAVGSEVVAHFIADSAATTIIGGGNTVEIFSRLKLLGELTFASTGGGATLKLLSGERLPGLVALD